MRPSGLYRGRQGAPSSAGLPDGLVFPQDTFELSTGCPRVKQPDCRNDFFASEQYFFLHEVLNLRKYAVGKSTQKFVLILGIKHEVAQVVG